MDVHVAEICLSHSVSASQYFQWLSKFRLFQYYLLLWVLLAIFYLNGEIKYTIQVYLEMFCKSKIIKITWCIWNRRFMYNFVYCVLYLQLYKHICTCIYMIYTQVVLHLYLPAFQLNVLNVPVVDVKLMKVSRKCIPYKNL